jgi:hypothetical protein
VRINLPIIETITIIRIAINSIKTRTEISRISKMGANT